MKADQITFNVILGRRSEKGTIIQLHGDFERKLYKAADTGTEFWFGETCKPCWDIPNGGASRRS